MTEAALQAAVMDLAALLGWRCVHFRPAQLPSGKWATHMSGQKGWPDCSLARRGVLVTAELKRDGENPTQDQRAWLDVLGTVPGVHACVWRPADWRSGEIERVLRGGP
jgi:hypothetical protein